MTDPLPRSARAMQRTAFLSIIAALVLVAVKLGAGIASGSLGLVAEALHSATDLIAAVLTFVAVRVGQRPPDPRHPWGHGRAEHLAALAESFLLLGATAYIAARAVQHIIEGGGDVNASTATLAAVLFVIIVDAWRTSVSLRASRAFRSPAFASNAVHFAGDLAGSIAVLTGLILVRSGVAIGDAVAALIVAAIVASAAWRLMWINAQVLMDVAPVEAEQTARDAITALDLPLSLTRLRIRRSAGSYLADVVIAVSATDHVSQGHALANAVEEAVEAALPGSDVVVHVEPGDDAQSIRDRATAAALSLPGIHEVHNVAVLLVDGEPEVSMHLKLRGDMLLTEAHELADQVEAHVQDAVPGVAHVDVHIEPIETGAWDTDPVDDSPMLAEVRRVVLEVTGRAAVAARMRNARKGLTAYVTVLADPDLTLHDAHVLATRVEEELRAQVPGLAEAIVHTEPDEVRITAPGGAARPDPLP